MFKDIRGVVNGKTLVGVLLGAVLALSMVFTDLPDFLPIPDILIKVLAGVPTALVLFGLFDAAQQELEGIKQKLRAFLNTSPFYGIALEGLITVINGLMATELPSEVMILLHVLSGALVVLGLKGQAVTARKNNASIPDSFAMKYKKAA